MKKRKRRYWCPHCKQIVTRVSDKQWIKSICENGPSYIIHTGIGTKVVHAKDVRLQLLTKPKQ